MRLLSLRQKNPSVVDFLVEFWILAADLGWNEAAPWGEFLQGLSKHVEDKLRNLRICIPSSLWSFHWLSLRHWG